MKTRQTPHICNTSFRKVLDIGERLFEWEYWSHERDKACALVNRCADVGLITTFEAAVICEQIETNTWESI